MITQFAVMGDMGISHQQIVVADKRHADIGAGGAMDGNEFPDYVEVTNDNAGFFPAEFQILRRSADRAKLKNTATFTDMSIVVYYGMRTDYCIFANSDIGAYY
jgi:hypothetical protein